MPSIKTAFVQLLVCTIINDVWFYWFHRALHHPKLYWIHKRHHLFHKSQIAFAAMYAHGIEGLLTGLIPVFMGPCFFGMHGATVVLFYAIRIWEGVQAHCKSERTSRASECRVSSRDTSPLDSHVQFEIRDQNALSLHTCARARLKTPPPFIHTCVWRHRFCSSARSPPPPLPRRSHMCVASRWLAGEAQQLSEARRGGGGSSRELRMARNERRGRHRTTLCFALQPL